jgi:iron complex outermembrane receptor protein
VARGRRAASSRIHNNNTAIMHTSLRAAPFLTIFLSCTALAQQDAAPATVPMPRVVVNEQRPGPQGSAEEGYRVGSPASLGPLGSSPILDLPYVVSILPRELIENSQARNFKEVSKYLPLVQFQEQQGPQILRPQTRGLQGGNFQNSRADGMTMFITVANAMEQFEQIEVVNGLSASLYGPANPSGMFNFVSKRPKPLPFARVNLGYDSDGIFTGMADFGGPIGDTGVFSYRINALGANGEGYVDHSHLMRRLGTVALDAKPDKDSVVEFTYSDYHIDQKGYPGWFTYGETIVLPDAPDPTRVGYGQSYAGVEMLTKMVIVKYRHDLSPDWHFVIGGLNQDARRNINTPVNNLRNNAGDYISSFGNGFAPRFVIDSDMGYLNGVFSTGSWSHDMTFGTAGYRSRTFSVRVPATPASVLLGSANINAPVIFPEPAQGPPAINDMFNSSTVYQQGVNVSDTVRFTDSWSVRAGVSQDWFHVANYNAAGATLPGYDNNGASPTASVMFKPRADMTAYATWASALQAGDTAPGTAANAGQSLAPYRSKGFEVGFKSNFHEMDFNVALFSIERPFANIDPTDSVFKISGNQLNRGLEVTALGRVTERLTFYGGATALNAKLRDTGNAATNDKWFVGAPKYRSNILLEYRIPGIEQLIGTFDWQYSSKRAGNDTNTFWVKPYDVFDLGVRYASPIMNHLVTWRAAIQNLGDERYWSTVAPSNLTGTNTGNLVAHLGSPRTYAVTVSIDL